MALALTTLNMYTEGGVDGEGSVQGWVGNFAEWPSMEK